MEPSFKTPTRVAIRWSQPDFSFNVTEYTISLERLSSQSCSSVSVTRDPVTTTPNVTSMFLEGLQPASDYSATITASYTVYNTFIMSSASVNFTTRADASMYHSRWKKPQLVKSLSTCTTSNARTCDSQLQVQLNHGVFNHPNPNPTISYTTFRSFIELSRLELLPTYVHQYTFRSFIELSRL